MISSPQTLLVVAAISAVVAHASFAQEIDVSKPPYNADMTGVADGTGALNSAIADATASGGPRAVYIPAGILKITSTISLSSAVRIFGTNALATTIKWAGSNGGKMISVTAQGMGGGGLSNMTLNGDNLAADGLSMDGSSNGKYDFLDIVGFTTGYGLKVTGSTYTGSWNVFSNILISNTTNGNSCLWISGSAAGLGGGNACHNTFINVLLVHGGTRPALRLGACDNNNFTDVFINRNNGAAAGVLVDPAEVSNFPSGNIFFHLQAGDGGWVQPNTTAVAPGWVFGYQQDNGQPDPVLNGTPLFWTDNGGNLWGVKINGAVISGGASGASLDLGSTIVADKFDLYHSGNTHYGFGIATAEMRMFVPTGGHLSLGEMSQADGVSFTERFRFYANGNFELPSGQIVNPTILTPNIVGTTTANNAAAGSVGEYVTASRSSSALLALSSGTVDNVTSITLTAGDWDVSGVVSFIAGSSGTQTSDVVVGTSSTSATLGPEPSYLQWMAPITTAYLFSFIPPDTRYNLSATTTIYLVARSTWTTSTLSAFGTIKARRAR